MLDEVAERDDPQAAQAFRDLRADARERLDRDVRIDASRERRGRTPCDTGEAGRRDGRADGEAQSGFNSSLRASRRCFRQAVASRRALRALSPSPAPTTNAPNAAPTPNPLSTQSVPVTAAEAAEVV